MNKKKLFFIICTLLYSITSSAQNSQFGNYQNAFLYLNPAMTSMGETDFRISSISRQQWLSNDKLNLAQFSDGYKSQYFSTEYAFGKFGIGLMILDEKAGDKDNTYFHTQTLGLSIANAQRLNDDLQLSLGAQINYHSSRLIGNYILIDDFIEGLDISYSTGGLSYLSFSTGLFLKHSNFHLGASLFDLVRFDATDDKSSVISNEKIDGVIRFNSKIHGKLFGLLPNENTVFGLSFYIKKIEKKTQAEGGFFFYKKLNDLPLLNRPPNKLDNPVAIFRLNYRGRPRISEPYRTRDAVITSFGFSSKQNSFEETKEGGYGFGFELIYTHEFTISGLGSPQHSNEISLVFLFNTSKNGVNWKRNRKISNSRKTANARAPIRGIDDCVKQLKDIFASGNHRPFGLRSIFNRGKSYNGQNPDPNKKESKKIKKGIKGTEKNLSDKKQRKLKRRKAEKTKKMRIKKKTLKRTEKRVEK